MAEYRLPPRQKMINLVYIILIAMLAINISADTLDTYSLLNKGVTERISGLQTLSKKMAEDLAAEDFRNNSAITEIDSMASELIVFIDRLKEDIARAADKKKYTCSENLRAQEELNAVPDVMLSPINSNATHLHEAMTAYKDTLLARISSPDIRTLVSSYLNLDSEKRLTSWEKATFTSMPAIGGITYLNTLKENILVTKIEAYKDISASFQREAAANSDSTDGEYRYVLINNSQKVVDKDGTIEVPVVNAAPYIESVVYAGFDNPIDILAIGITPDKINFDVEGGDGYLKDGTYYICPDEQRKEVVLHMSCTRDSVFKDLGSQTFKVKSLPTPSPYIILSDNTKYTGNVPIEKERIASTVSIGASISEPVNISYKIIRFEIVLIKNNSKDVLSATSYSPTLTEEQKQILLSAENGDKIYFTDITVKSPKGESVYNLPPVSAPVYE